MPSIRAGPTRGPRCWPARPPTFDPLAELVGRARSAGLQVHAWLNVNLVAGATALPSARQHVAVQHPEWLMVPRALAPSLLRLSPGDPKYLATLATWSHRNNATVEGVFASPIPEGAHDRLDATIAHLTSRYALDGLHLDYIRFPSPDFDVSRAALDDVPRGPGARTDADGALHAGSREPAPVRWRSSTCTRHAGRPSVATASPAW